MLKHKSLIEVMKMMPACPYGKVVYRVKPYDTLWRISQKFGTSVDALLALNPGVEPRRLMVGQPLYVCPGFVDHAPNVPDIERNGQTEVSDTLRMLWEQHVYWTRMVIESAVLGLPDADVVTERLLRNPKDFEAALRPFYGDATAHRFGVLLDQHLRIATELVAAVKAGDQQAAADAERRWYENAGEIADFLGSINPYWSAEAWEAMMQEHLARTKAEAAALLAQKYPESIRMFDMIELQALKMADEMTEGLLKQFPYKF